MRRAWGIVGGVSVILACTACEPRRTSDSAPAGGATVTARAVPTTTTAADTDDFGIRIPVDANVAMRVVSLVPAATEVIFAMGRGDRLVGRTTWDTYPDSAKLVTNVGDGIRPNVEVVIAQKPSLVVLYAGNDNRAAAASFAQFGIAVYAIKVDHIADFARLTTQLGRLLNAPERAAQVVDSVTRTLAKVREAVRGAPRPTVVWPLWDSPVMVVGRGSFLGELLDIAGADNVFGDLAQPSPEVNIEEIAKRNPSFVLASPMSAKRLAQSAPWRVVRTMQSNGLRLVDTTVVGRPTVTLGMAAVSLAKLLHPDRASRLP